MDLDLSKSKAEWAGSAEEVQGGAAWHAWRNQGLGASDAAIIMGCSPWKTRFRLWQEKSNLVEREEAGYAAERGHDLEPYARAAFEESFWNLNLEEPKRKFVDKIFDKGKLRASMDGWCGEIRSGVELKCPGQKTHDEAKAGKCPEWYYWQIQHQYAVTDAITIYYATYLVPKGTKWADGDLAWFPVERNQKDIDRYLKEAHKFLDLVESGVPPEYSDKDYETVKHPDLKKLSDEFIEAQAEFKAAELRLSMIKEKLIDFTTKREWARIRGYGVRVQSITRKGNVQYKQIPELEGVDLESFRAKPSTYFKVDLDSER